MDIGALMASSGVVLISLVFIAVTIAATLIVSARHDE